jgi:hypothetical protein
VPDTLLDVVKEEQNRARDVGRNARGGHAGGASSLPNLNARFLIKILFGRSRSSQRRCDRFISLLLLHSGHILQPEGEEEDLCVVEEAVGEELDDFSLPIPLSFFRGAARRLSADVNHNAKYYIHILL